MVVGHQGRAELHAVTWCLVAPCEAEAEPSKVSVQALSGQDASQAGQLCGDREGAELPKGEDTLRPGLTRRHTHPSFLVMSQLPN